MRQNKKHGDEQSVSRRAPAGADERRKGKTKQPEGAVSDHKFRLSRNGHGEHRQSHTSKES
jgi:hypothetical protein